MGEIVLALVGKELKFCESTSGSTSGARTEVKVSRNKKTKLPTKNLVYRSGVFINDFLEIQNFSTEAQKICSELNLEGIWKLMDQELEKNGNYNVDIGDIADLLDLKNSPHLIAALYLHINENPMFFSLSKNKLVIHSRETVEVTEARQIKQEREYRDEVELADAINNKSIPANLTDHQLQLLEHLKNFVVLGESYTRSAKAIDLIKNITAGSQENLQKTGFKILETAGLFNLDIPYELETLKIHTVFREEIAKEAKRMTFPDQDWEDLSDLPTYTIDDESTLDKDDAFSLDENGNRIWIHIAAASTVIPKDSIFDLEAKYRKSSVYLPEITIPMLPKEISENIASLKPNKKRLCLSLVLDLDEKSNIVKSNFVKTFINTDQSFTYESADLIFDNTKHKLHKIFSKLQKFTKSHSTDREIRGAQIFNKPDAMIKIGEEGKISVSMSSPNSPSQKLISELMIVYNVKMAEFFSTNRIPALYRYQLESQILPPKEKSDLLNWYRASKHMRPAKISIDSDVHSGLGVDLYCQSTSPIRRFSDLCLQRQAIEYIESNTHSYENEELSNIGFDSEIRVKEMRRYESKRKKYWLLKYLSQEFLVAKSSTPLSATVLENHPERTAVIELTEYLIRGRCLLSQKYKPGSLCELKLNGVDLWDQTAQFSLV